MTKELIYVKREYVSIYDLFEGEDIKSVTERFKEMVDSVKSEAEKGDYIVKFRCESTGYDGGYDTEAVYYRYETDEEYNQRLEEEQERRERNAKRRENQKAKALAKALETESEERALLARLKAKYDNI